MYVHAFIWTYRPEKIHRMCSGLGESQGKGRGYPGVWRPRQGGRGEGPGAWRGGARRSLSRPGSAHLRTRPVEQRGRQVAQIAFRLGIVGGGAQAGFIHVEFAVDLYLQAVTAL